MRKVAKLNKLHYTHCFQKIPKIKIIGQRLRFRLYCANQTSYMSTQREVFEGQTAACRAKRGALRYYLDHYLCMHHDDLEHCVCVIMTLNIAFVGVTMTLSWSLLTLTSSMATWRQHMTQTSVSETASGLR